MGIGSIGFPEILIIIVLALVFFGPNRMPEVARALGKAMREFRKGMNEVQRELEQAGREDRTPRWDSAPPRPAGPIDPGREDVEAGPAAVAAAGGEPTGGPPDVAAAADEPSTGDGEVAAPGDERPRTTGAAPAADETPAAEPADGEAPAAGDVAAPDEPEEPASAGPDA